MNKVMLTGAICVALSTSALSISAHASPEYTAGNTSPSSQLCMKIATGNKHQLRNAVEHIRPNQTLKNNYRFVADKVTCNGLNSVDFALDAKNYTNAKTLARFRTEKGDVSIQDIAALEAKSNDADSPKVFKADDYSASTRVCMAIASGSDTKLKNAVKDIRPDRVLKANYRFVVEDVKCNGLSSIEFALQTESYGHAELLAQYDRENGEQTIQKLASLRSKN